MQTSIQVQVDLILSFFVVLGSLSARGQPWQPSPGHAQLPIWPGVVPDAQPPTQGETSRVGEGRIAEKPVVGVYDVSHPTLTVYSPSGTNTGVAIVVFPGGGYKGLAIDLEGTEVCDWLTSKGITCVLLKYRVPNSGPYWDRGCDCHIIPRAPTALEDAQRTLGLVRFHAAEWHVDPHKIGVLGFSAGGHLVAATSTHFKRRLYAAVDAADKESCRPDFGVALYPGHLSVDARPSELSPDIHVTAETPPTFLLQAEDDPVDDVANSRVTMLRSNRLASPWSSISSRTAGTRSGCGGRSCRSRDGLCWWRPGWVVSECCRRGTLEFGVGVGRCRGLDRSSARRHRSMYRTRSVVGTPTSVDVQDSIGRRHTDIGRCRGLDRSSARRHRSMYRATSIDIQD